jgi:hypothetical protein
MATRYKIAKTASPTFTGVVTIPTINLTGGQIAFPAAQSASADVNTLDDYEEGDCTLGVSFGGSSVGVTYSYQGGYYTKIGNLVTVTGYCQLTSKGAQAGTALLTGLPFLVENNNAAIGTASLLLSVVSFANQFVGYTSANSSTVSLCEVSEAGTTSSLTNADFANGSYLVLTISYRVKS